MGKTFRPISFVLTITAGGSGDEWGSLDVFPPGVSGKVTMITVRRDASDDDGTVADIYLATNQHALEAEPPVDDLVLKAAAVALTQSALASSLQSGLDYPSRFQDGLRLGAEVTFGGAGDSVTHWTIEGELDD